MQEKRQGTEMKTGVYNSTEMISGQATIVLNWNMNYRSLPFPAQPAEPPNENQKKGERQIRITIRKLQKENQVGKYEGSNFI